MMMRAAVTAAGMTIAGLAFTAGVGAGAALVGGAYLARKAMQKRKSWKDDHDSVAASDAMMEDLGPTPGANPI